MKVKRHIIIFLFGLGVLFSSLTSCVDETFTTDPSAKLSFSVDTLSFDTLFSTIPSRTAIFKVYNKNDKALNIDMIRLSKGSDSYFRFNADGRIPGEGSVLTDIIIRSNDSLYVFVELTAHESSENMPVTVSEKMEFITNGINQEVQLRAYSQDAYIFNSHSLRRDTILSGNKPFLVFGYLHVPEGVTLTLQAGTTLYFHSGAHLIVDGHLKAIGTHEQPVVLRGDRFDAMPDVLQTPYDFLPSQWGNIYLQNYNGNHLLKHTIIRGSDLGILLIGANRNKPTLTLESSQIHSSGRYGIYSQNGNLRIFNSEISNCAESCLLLLGGTAQVTHSTIANYYMWGSRSSAAVVIANYVSQQGYLMSFPIERAVFENSIIYGSLFDELLLQSDTINNTQFNVLFSHCLIKSKESKYPYFNQILWSNASNSNGADTVFVNTRYSKENGYYNFKLIDNSPARNTANYTVAQMFPIDYDGNNRLADGNPDMGAYEY